MEKPERERLSWQTKPLMAAQFLRDNVNTQTHWTVPKNVSKCLDCPYTPALCQTPQQDCHAKHWVRLLQDPLLLTAQKVTTIHFLCLEIVQHMNQVLSPLE